MKNAYKIVAVIGLFGALTACGGADDAPKKETHAAEHQMHDEASGHNMHNEGGAQAHTDQRIAVNLSAGQRLHVLEEMRGLLGSTQGIVEGLATGDMDLVQTSALAAGTKGRKTTENNMMHKKMPPEWMQLGMSAHKSMDKIAQMAADGKPAKDIQLKLVDTMNACTACHASFYLPNP